MFEWWQAIFLAVATSAVTGVLGIVAGFATSRFTAASARDAESRQAARQRREQRIQPVVNFLQLARRYAGGDFVDIAAQRAYERFSPDERRQITLDEWRKRVKSTLLGEDDPDMILVSREGAVAVVAAPTSEIVDAVFDVDFAVLATPMEIDALYVRIRIAEELIENYLRDV